MDKSMTELLPEMLNGAELERSLQIKPAYDESIRSASETQRLMALQDLYRIYIPTQMSREIYVKMYLALARSLEKKQTLAAVSQFSINQNQKMGGKRFTSIMGGSDSFTITGESGIGKSAAVSRVMDLISGQAVINLPNSMRIIPCLQVQTPADCSVKGLLMEILRKVDEEIHTNYYHNALRARATTDLLIGSVSNVMLNHVGLLVVDEIQNVVNAKSGKVVVGMLTQLINNAGVSICMVGTPESNLFFGQEMMLARRAVGLSYHALSYDDDFRMFCEELFRYQYVRTPSALDEGLLQWLYHHSGGNASIVVSLLHDAQETAILDGHEKLDGISLEKAYATRLAMLHGYLYPEPYTVRHGTRRQKTVEQMAPSSREDMPVKKADDLLEDIRRRVARLGTNIVDEFKIHDVVVEEVTV